MGERMCVRPGCPIPRVTRSSKQWLFCSVLKKLYFWSGESFLSSDFLSFGVWEKALFYDFLLYAVILVEFASCGGMPDGCPSRNRCFRRLFSVLESWVFGQNSDFRTFFGFHDFTIVPVLCVLTECAAKSAMIAMVASFVEIGKVFGVGLVSGFCCDCGMWANTDAHVRVCVWVRDPARNEVVQTPVICNQFHNFLKTGDNLEYRQNGFVKTEKWYFWRRTR